MSLVKSEQNMSQNTKPTGITTTSDPLAVYVLDDHPDDTWEEFHIPLYKRVWWVVRSWNIWARPVYRG